MFDWLRLLLMMFYAPGRALGEVRDRAPLGPAATLTLGTHLVYLLYSQWPLMKELLVGRGLVLTLTAVVFSAASVILFIGLVFTPISIFLSNLFERRASLSIVLQQEYAAVCSCIFYAWATATILALPLAIIARATGYEASVLASLEQLRQIQSSIPPQGIPPEQAQQILNQLTPHLSRLVPALFLMSPLPLFCVWAVIALRQAFNFSWLRAVILLLLTGLLMIPVVAILTTLFGWVVASPLLLLLLFFLLRGYMSEVTRTHRASASFKQNLEAATLNPADASAHYNLGLIHQQRNELDQARQRFERTVEIDEEELDAHYQLGRIARSQARLTDAIKHFEQVVSRDRTHSQHEIWREIGATYIAAGQFEDARDALENFLEHRQADPQGLYLMGRAHAGLGHRREAATAMQACIEAVKTAPAYKYRTEKRWLNEAQQFLKTVTSDG